MGSPSHTSYWSDTSLRRRWFSDARPHRPGPPAERRQRRRSSAGRRLGRALALGLALACGEGTPAPKPPAERLAVVGPELTELLVELGVGPHIVAADSASLGIPGLPHAVDLGDPDAPSVERAQRARPDRVLVLADPSQPAGALADALAREGVPATLLAPEDADAVIAAIRRVGLIVDRELRATALTAVDTREVADVATRRDGLPRLRVAWVLEADPLTVVGGTGLLHQVLELAGADNAFHGRPDPRLPATPEALAESAPDVLLGTPPLPALAGVAVVAIDPALAALPLLDLPGRVRALHAALYPPEGGGSRETTHDPPDATAPQPESSGPGPGQASRRSASPTRGSRSEPQKSSPATR